MSDTCKTVRIVRPECPGGFCEINEEDLKDGDKLYGAESEPVAATRKACEMTVDEIKAAIETATHDELVELYNDEIANKGRVKAVEALEAAIDEFENDDQE